MSFKCLVTGSAGFIGSALTIRLLERGDIVIGIDNHNDYYDPAQIISTFVSTLLIEKQLKRFLTNTNRSALSTLLHKPVSDTQLKIR